MNNTERVDEGWVEHLRNENLAMAGMHVDWYCGIKDAGVSDAMRYDDQDVEQMQEVDYINADSLDSLEAVENPKRRDQTLPCHCAATLPEKELARLFFSVSQDTQAQESCPDEPDPWTTHGEGCKCGFAPGRKCDGKQHG